MLSFIITSYNEPNTIGKAVECIGKSSYSGMEKDYEIIQVSPDVETLNAGLKKAKELKISKHFVQFEDPGEGKPHALNIAFEKAQGDILILTDGDVYFGKNAVKELVKPFNKKNIGGVTGHPISQDTKKNMMGYYGHLLSTAAHHKRENTFKKKHFFPMSGYIMAMRKIDLNLPKDVLSDDAYISYSIYNQGFKIVYAPKAKAYVKFPRTLKDYYKQKARSLGGHIQLKRYSIVHKGNRTRTFVDELKYFWFPFRYASNPKEYWWSLLLFPIRLLTWVKIFCDRKILKKDFVKTWERINSTK